MPRPRLTAECAQCGEKHYAKGLCKPCYMQKNRQNFEPNVSGRATAKPIDPEDLWQFVKRELKLG